MKKKKPGKNYAIKKIKLAEFIAQSEIKIETEQFYIVPSKLNYL